MARAFFLGWLCLIPSVSAAASAGSAEYLYKEAMLQETTARDPESAIRLYEQFLKNPGPDRVMQAGAWLHLGLCQAQIGRTEDAKTAWKKVVQDYSDQPDSYAEALKQLQQMQAAEQSKVIMSSPVVKVVYETPPARWVVEFPKTIFPHTIDGKGRLTDTAAGLSLALSHFPEPDLGVTIEIGGLGSYRPATVTRDIGYFSVGARGEKPLASALRLYAQGGPGLYWFSFDYEDQSEGKANIGVQAGAGLTIGLARGFTFQAGYALHAFGQSTPSEDFQDKIPSSEVPDNEAILQNRGIRLLGGPLVSLSYRW